MWANAAAGERSVSTGASMFSDTTVLTGSPDNYATAVSLLVSSTGQFACHVIAYVTHGARSQTDRHDKVTGCV